MTPLQMALECSRAMSESSCAMFVIPKGKTPKDFPRGEVMNETERNGVVECAVFFDPEAVLAWLIKQEFIVMTRTGNTLQFSDPTGAALDMQPGQK